MSMELSTEDEVRTADSQSTMVEHVKLSIDESVHYLLPFLVHISDCKDTEGACS